MSRLELAIAWRYLRSRRGSKLLSFISLIAISGVGVGVSALIVIIGVMEGLQRDLREKILIGSPDVRVLPWGEDLKVDDWRRVVAKLQTVPGVVAAAPFVHTPAIATTGHAYAEGVFVQGIEAQGRGVQDVTGIRKEAKLSMYSGSMTPKPRRKSSSPWVNRSSRRAVSSSASSARST